MFSIPLQISQTSGLGRRIKDLGLVPRLLIEDTDAPLFIGPQAPRWNWRLFLPSQTLEGWNGGISALRARSLKATGSSLISILPHRLIHALRPLVLEERLRVVRDLKLLQEHLTALSRVYISPRGPDWLDLTEENWGWDGLLLTSIQIEKPLPPQVSPPSPEPPKTFDGDVLKDIWGM